MLALLLLNFLAMNCLLLAMPVANVSSKRLRTPLTTQTQIVTKIAAIIKGFQLFHRMTFL
ncbi:MAG: hypothetical protein K0Q73_2259 [Paenibacillus sp.]|jgi:hypothetical protein|nr:hypothetical protein [Paenibacillus sp.]